MRIDVLTIFPEMFGPVLGASIMKRAQESGRVAVHVHDIRKYSTNKHRKVDDRPFGGGPGMVMGPQPLFDAIEAVSGLRHDGGPATGESQHQGARQPRGGNTPHIALLSPQGRPFTQAEARRLADEAWLMLICGHYEGVDQRVIDCFVDEEISIGDYVLTCGELPAMVVIDAVVRLLPGVLGHDRSTEDESFERGLLEYPQYTRPANFRGVQVPDVLLSGDHDQIEQWRREQSLRVTAKQRPDLLKDGGRKAEDGLDSMG